jgi:hypothetical protein
VSEAYARVVVILEGDGDRQRERERDETRDPWRDEII